MTLDGTCSWLVSDGDGFWLIDPGPEGAQEHLKRILSAAEGQIKGVILTHKHADHAGALPELAALMPATELNVWVKSASELESVSGILAHDLVDGQNIGPFTVHDSPGHRFDHICLVKDEIVFTGDHVLGFGSTLLVPYPGSLNGHLVSLKQLIDGNYKLALPGHGPIISDPSSRFREYLTHRLDRETKLIRALNSGLRTVDELVAEAWSDAPVELHFACALNLETHLIKLAEDGFDLEGVERRDYSYFPGVLTS